MTSCILQMVEKEEDNNKTIYQKEEDTTKYIDLLRELQDEIRTCQNVVMSEDPVLFDSHNKIKQAVLLQAYNLNLLIKHYPEHYPYKQCSIFSAISEEYRRKSVSSKTMDAIYHAFSDPEYDVYKVHPYNTAKRKLKTQQEIDSEAPGEKYSIDIRLFDAIRLVEENPDHPKVQNFRQKIAKEHVKTETKERKDREDEDKITIPRPDWIPADLDGQDSLTYRAAVEYTKAWKDITTRIWQYPPAKENDEFYAEGIETMHALIVPGTDLKYVRDTLSYLDITLEKEQQSIHSAMSKSKILTPSGKYRKVTREQIADIAPQMILLSIHIVQKLPGFIRFCLYLLREQKPYSGEFHLNRHDKLSESAFGKSGFVD